MPKSLQRWVTSLSVSSKVPSSSRNSMRSRADILPSLCWRSRRFSPPPSSARRLRFFSSASFSSRFMCGRIIAGRWAGRFALDHSALGGEVVAEGIHQRKRLAPDPAEAIELGSVRDRRGGLLQIRSQDLVAILDWETGKPETAEATAKIAIPVTKI